MPSRESPSDHKPTKVGFKVGFAVVDDGPDEEDGLLKTSDITESKSDEESVVDFGIENDECSHSKKPKEFSFPGDKYGEPTTCLDYVCVNNLERLVRKCSHKRKHGLTGTDDHIQHEGKTHHDVVDQPVRGVVRRRSSFMDLAAHGDMNSDEEDDERQLDEADLREPPKMLTRKQKRDRADGKMARKLAVFGLRMTGRGNELEKDEHDGSSSSSDSDISHEDLADMIEHGMMTSPRPSQHAKKEDKKTTPGGGSSIKTDKTNKSKNSKKKEGGVNQNSKKHHHKGGKESGLSKYLQKTIDSQLNIGGRPVNDFRPIDDQYALIALQNKLKKMSAAYAPSKRVSMEPMREKNQEYLESHFALDEEDIAAEAERIFKMCDLNSDKVVTKEEIKDKVHDNVEMAEAIGMHYDVRDNLNGEYDDKFETFWNAYYHGYKATEYKEGGFSKNDFIDMVTRNRLARSAAYMLFEMIDIQKHGYVDIEDMKKAVCLHPELMDLLMLENEEDREGTLQGRVHRESSFFDARLTEWWDKADETQSGLLSLDEFTKAYQARSLVAYRWKPDSLKYKISFKRTEPAPELEEKWFQLNGYRGFDYTFVSPWPEARSHGLFLEQLLTSLKDGGLDIFAYRTSSHGVGINRDARVVIKVRLPMKRMETYASSTGYRFLLSKERLRAETSQLHEIDFIDSETPFLYIEHDEERVKLHPYDFIYCPYHKSDWWKRAKGRKGFFHCSGGLKHPFTSRHRITLLVSIMTDPTKYGGCGLKLHKMNDVMCKHFPLHRPNMLDQIDAQFKPPFHQRLQEFQNRHAIDADSEHYSACGAVCRWIPIWCCSFVWFQLSYLWHVPVQLLRDYYGEKTALYFAFVGEFVRWQLLLSFLGGIASLLIATGTFTEGGAAPWIAIVASLTTELFCRHWKYFEYAFATRFGVNKNEGFIQMRDRPDFRGVLKRSVIDGTEIMHYPWERRLARYMISTFIIFLLAVLGFILVGSILGLRVYMVRAGESTHKYADQVSGSVLGVYVTVSNEVFRSVALQLTKWENHRTDAEFENALVFKLFVVQFINSYATLFYVAFFKGPIEGCDRNDCTEDLTYRLLFLLIARVSYKFLEKAVLPRCAVILRKCRALMTAKNLEFDFDYVADHQMHLNDYDQIMETTISYDELVVDLGYMVLFAAAVPITPLLMLPLMLIRKYCDGSRLTFDFKRPLPIATNTIGAWNGVLQVLARITMISNFGIVFFTSNGLQASQRRETNMFYAELCAVIMAFSLVVFRPPTESHAIKVQRLRQQHIISRLEAMALKHADDMHFRDNSDEAHILLKHAKQRKSSKDLVKGGFHHYAV